MNDRRRHPPRELEGSPGVIRAVMDRARRMRSGGPREDGLKLGIVAEGGAMRGIVSGGAIVGLAELGLHEVFDVAYGASAGALNLAYFVAGSSQRAGQIYFDLARSTRFVNPLRVHKVMDLDFLFERIIAKSFPIDRAVLAAAPTELKVSVTCARTGRNELLSVRDPSVDALALLKASSAVPFYYGRSVTVAGREYVDGMASNALPVREALADGCTHVLVLLSGRPGEGSARAAAPGRHDIAWPERLLLRRHETGFRRAYLTRRRRLRVALATAGEDPRVHAMVPSSTCPVPSRICRDPKQLAAAYEAARGRAIELFEDRPGP